MVGDGPMAANLEWEAPRYGVELLGRRDDVPAVLRSCDVFLFTSMPEGEGMPGVLIEAGLAGLPTVATDVPGANTVIASDRSGFVVAPDDIETFIACTESLVTDESLRREMGAEARQRCLKHFTLDASAAALGNAMAALLESPGR